MQAWPTRKKHQGLGIKNDHLLQTVEGREAQSRPYILSLYSSSLLLHMSLKSQKLIFLSLKEVKQNRSY